MTDVFIRDITLYDGTGAAPRIADILIKYDCFAAVGNLQNPSAGKVIEGKGLAAAPGFIDTHAHSEGILLIDPQHDNSLRQGVTTEILGQDGLSYSPLSKTNYLLNRQYLSGLLGLPPIDLNMTTISEFRSHYHEKVSINTAYCVPHSALRLENLGFTDVPLEGKSLNEAKNLLREGMDQGALGLSTGMSYFPNAWSDTEELIQLCKVVAKRNGIYVTHLRDVNTERGYGNGGVSEALEIGRRSGVKVHFSHYRTDKTSAGHVDEKMVEIDKAISEGVDVSLELHPYPTGSTFPLSYLPSYAHEGGHRGVMYFLKNSKERAKLAHYLDNEFSGNLNDYVFSYSPCNPNLEGKPLTSIAKQRNLSLGTALCDILLETGGLVGHWETPPTDMAIWEQINLDAMELLSRKDYMIGSDAIPLGKFPHPRAYGTFPRVIGRFQRKYGVMKLEQTIQRVTENPAKRFNLKKRGNIREGYYADLVIFDPNTVMDNSTYDDPIQYPSGILYVFVNGVLAVENNLSTGSRSGRAVP